MVWTRLDSEGYLTGVDTEPRGEGDWREFDNADVPNAPEGQRLRLVDGVWTTSTGKPVAERDQIIARLWAEANAMGQEIADTNSRERYLAWMIDPSTPEVAKGLIDEIQAAMDNVWAQYATAKAAVLAGGEPQALVKPTGVPTFWDVAGTVQAE